MATSICPVIRRLPPPSLPISFGEMFRKSARRWAHCSTSGFRWTSTRVERPVWQSSSLPPPSCPNRAVRRGRLSRGVRATDRRIRWSSRNAGFENVARRLIACPRGAGTTDRLKYKRSAIVASIDSGIDVSASRSRSIRGGRHGASQSVRPAATARAPSSADSAIRSPSCSGVIREIAARYDH